MGEWSQSQAGSFVCLGAPEGSSDDAACLCTLHLPSRFRSCVGFGMNRSKSLIALGVGIGLRTQCKKRNLMILRVRDILALITIALCVQTSASAVLHSAYHGVSDAQHQTNFVNLKNAGYRPIALSVYGDPANERYAAVWVKRAGPLFAAIHNTNSAGYQAFFNTMTTAGYRPIIVSATGPVATATFAAVFEKSSSPGWFASHDMITGPDTTPGTFEYNCRFAKENGQIPISITKYGSTGVPRYAAVWAGNPKNVLWNYTTGPFANDYQEWFNACDLMKYRPSCIGVSTDQRYASIFRDDLIGNYRAYHDLPEADYQAAYLLRTGQGYYPILVQGSGIGAATRYAAVFAKQETPIARQMTVTGPTPPHLTATETAKLDTAMKSFMQTHGVRASQFSFSRFGKMIYSRAFTWAEPGYPITQPDSPMRLASNSKAFAAAAIYKLSLADPTLLGKKAFAFLGITAKALDTQIVDPRINDITVQHLVDHEGGWDWGLSGFDPVFHCRDISWELGETLGPLSAMSMARFMYGEPLQFTPGNRSEYANIGYVLMGLIVEKISGKTFEEYVKEDVLAPDGITDVWLARTHVAQQLPGEGYYHDPAIGLTSIIPNTFLLLPSVNGGGGFLNEAMHGGGGMAATATSMTQFIYHNAVWGMGGRNAGAARTGSMPGTSSYSVSRSTQEKGDFAFILNTRRWKAGTSEQMSGQRAALEAILDDIKPRIASLAVWPATVPGGQPSAGVVTLAWKAPLGGITVALVSTNPAAATVPASVTIQGGHISESFPITSLPQTTNKTTLIRATHNGLTKSKELTVTPATLQSLTLSAASVTGGTSLTGTVTLNGVAAVDTTVTVTSANSAAHPVVPVVVLAGSSSRTFNITTDPVASDKTGNVTASLGAVSKPVSLLVKAPVLATLKLTPNPVSGGNVVSGQVSLSGIAAMNTVVLLANANTKATLSASSVTVLAGAKTASFTMTTRTTFLTVNGVVAATLGAVTKKVTLSVTP